MSVLELKETPDGVALPLRVKPKGRANRVTGVRGSSLGVEVTAAPEKGEANRACQQVVAEALGVKRNAVRILSGLKARDKIVLVTGVPAKDIETRLKEAISKR